MKRSSNDFKKIKFMGVTLGGGKGRKTCVSVLEYFTKEKKLFLSQLHEQIEDNGKQSSDTQIIQIIEKNKKELHGIALDAPLKLPKCLRCRLVCPGHEKCQEPEIKWMWKRFKKRAPEKRPNKIFTPYTERCVEQYIASDIHPDLVSDHAFGSNRAPLAARALYLKRRIPKGIRVHEVIPRVAVWHLGLSMGFRKNNLIQYKQLTKGPTLRRQFLDRWSDEGLSFIYHRDFKLMVKDSFAFDSFIGAYASYLKYRGQCINPPKDFPRSEAWVLIPEL